MAVLLGSLLLPGQAHVERDIEIDRPVHTVYTVLNGYQHFSAWSPWAGLDPQMEVTRSGPSHGQGARYQWSSKMASVGSGSQEIILSQADERIDMALEFSGMDARQTASFEFEPTSAGTRLTWSLDVDFGDSLFGRWFGLLLDRMVGRDYEQGLSRLKALLESMPEADFSGLEVAVTEVEARRIAFLSAATSTDSENIGAAYAQAFARIRSALQLDGLKPTGAPLVIGREWDEQADRFEFDAAFPVAESAQRKAAGASDAYQLGYTYAGRVLKTTHVGPYADLSSHLDRLMAYKRAMGFEDNGLPWDVYVSLGGNGQGKPPVTETYIPVK